jgi:hypothetical protein
MIAKALGYDEQAQKYLQQAIDLNPHFSLLYSNTATAALEDLKEGSDAASKGDK